MFGIKRSFPKKEFVSDEDLRTTGTSLKALVTSVAMKRGGYVVMCLWENPDLGTQSMYTSDILISKPHVRIGGEVTVYVDRINGSSRYLIDCV